MTNIEDVVRDVALKNRQSVKEDDPVMALVTIMNRIAVDWQGCLNAALEGHKNEYEGIADRWRKDATARAEKILNAALGASKDAMAKGMSEGAEKVTELVRQETREVLRVALVEQEAGLKKATDEFKRYVFYMLVGSAAVVVSFVLLLSLS